MDAPEEFLALVQQVKEHLRYYQELGLTQLGEAETLPQFAQAAAPTPLPAVALGQSTLAPDTTPINSLPAPAPPQARPALPAPVIPQENMPNTDELPALFGEPETAAAVPTRPVARVETLDDIRAEMGDCQRCKLWATRTNLVFGEGNPQAQLMFVGEGPGADEDATGRPFVGRAGQLLTKMIEAIDLKREQVYIANVVKSRPPGNRTPEADEVKACKPFLLRQIACIKPKLIVTLGNPATQSLLETKVGITRLRGEVQPYPHLPAVKVIPTFHPAYLLRSPDKKRETWEDLKKVRAFLRGELEP